MINKNKIDILHQEILINNPYLITKIEKATKLPPESSRQLLKETLRFLFLVANYKRRLSPSLLVDLAWHELILFTRNYEEICRENFEQFIHHTPGSDEKENQQQYKTTLKLYLLTFGDLPKQFWGNEVDSYNNNSACGSCESF